MKFNVAFLLASASVLLAVSAAPTEVGFAPAEAVGEEVQHLGERRICCKRAKPRDYCGPSGCCLWQECIVRGGPAQCGYVGCCFKWNCY
ncbi:hypothetical protein BGZ94_000886 [Podila epigama]|nr:hypothetical protein BGZ94_000886 [Podila epigama]